MPRYALGILIGGGLVVAGCLVGSFDKVDDHFNETGGSGGTPSGGSGGVGGGSGGTAGAGTGGTGGTGGSSPCDSCTDGPDGETSCCFTRPDGSSTCGYMVSDFGDQCLPLEGDGTIDSSCPDGPGAAALAGCCMPSGLCGLIGKDNQHGLGCMPSEAFGVTPPTWCGALPCANYCDRAALGGCGLFDPSAEFPIYACGQKCLALGCTDQITGVITTPCAFVNLCSGDGLPIYAKCAGPTFELSKCLGVVDCQQYCEMVVDTCNDQPNPRQFESLDQCVKFCSDWLPGDPSASDPSLLNSIFCRMNFAHLGNCAAAGAVGQGTGSVDKCGEAAIDSYCQLDEKRCPSQFQSDWTDLPKCKTTITIPSNGSFHYGANTTNTIECRIEKLLDGNCEEARKAPTTGTCL